MFGRLRPYMAALWQRPARALLALGVHPNVMTVIGTVGVVAGALLFFPRGGHWLFYGALFITFFVITDMLDGTMARLGDKSSRLGAFLDSTLDRVADAAIFGTIAWVFVDIDRLTALGALCTLAVGSLVPYARAKAEAIGVEAKGGLAERSDRLVVGLVAVGFYGIGIFPLVVLTWALWILTVLAAITVVQRIWAVVRHARLHPEWNARLEGGPQLYPHE
ncbi:phosphatidylinositol phosphate synthase [Demequina pelophila]|uniref:phosphatidylinositol phosphate synthase n=1 Tax=Demequina pelophila TaxID=1638984 RepID=UPI000781440F|nr:CDP-alcohol phosphatidyltransferase family protein [Demequina pelophila]